jgi:GTP pyrophosphokinase
MHEEAEYGYRRALALQGEARGRSDEAWQAWVRQLMEAQPETIDEPREFKRAFLSDLVDDEVYVFTPKGEVKTLPTGATPIDFAYAVHTDVGHRTVGAKINGRIVPLHYRLKNGDFVEILTSKAGRGPSRDWLSLAASSRARNKIRQWFSRETREDQEQKGREALESALKAAKLPYRKLAGSAVLAEVIRDMNFKKAEDFYLALGSGKVGAQAVVNKVLQRLKTEQAAEEEAVPLKAPRAKHAVGSENYGITCTASTTCSCGWRSAARRCPATRSSATSRWARASRSTAATART